MPYRNTHAENSGIHITEIMSRTDCERHKANQGSPCWHIRCDTNARVLPALCGTRIKKAGFVGNVSHESMQTKAQHDKKRAWHNERRQQARAAMTKEG